MRVSVVIPSYNCARFVTEAVASVLAQTQPAAEVIVVDDGSTDDTEERLRPYAGRICYIKKDNGGVATARNRGMKESTGDLIAFLDSDDTWHPRKLEIQVEYLHQNPEIGLLGTRTIDWPNEHYAELGEGIPERTEVPFEKLAVKNLFVTSSMIVRREVVAKVGDFDTALHGPEDYDFWLRCVRVTRAANLEAPLTGYREVPGSLGKRAVSMEAGMRRILTKLDASGAWQRRRILRRKAYAYLRYSCAYMYAAANQQGAALSRLIRSMACYPWPFRRDEVRMSFARPRLLFMTLLRMLHLKKAEMKSGNPPVAVATH